MTAIVDAFPRLRTKKFIVAPCICATMYLLGLTMCTQVNLPVLYSTFIGVFVTGYSVICRRLVVRTFNDTST